MQFTVYMIQTVSPNSNMEQCLIADDFRHTSRSPTALRLRVNHFGPFHPLIDFGDRPTIQHCDQCSVKFASSL